MSLKIKHCQSLKMSHVDTREKVSKDIDKEHVARVCHMQVSSVLLEEICLASSQLH
jgi:hypothetical protein